ncbi:MAG: hypothetical protein LBS52_06595 [Dysgonamonadaceae bacterium]|jgi:hypothetical protein|nr:hypothetical protein [Dysgonamonadaceae bacterium]
MLQKISSKLALLAIFAMSVFLYACEGGKIEPVPAVEKRTALVYIVAQNTLNRFVPLDLDEMKEGFAAIPNPDDYNLLAYVDDYDAPRLLKFEKENNQVVVDTVITYPDQNSLSLSVMSGVMKEIFSAYEAESYGLVLWSHANGWLPGSEQPKTGASLRSFGDDSGFYMDLLDLKTALRSCPKFEFILFDACNMQSVEMAYELREATKFFIGSPGEIPAYGAPYELVVPAMFSQSNPASEIAQQYFDYYDKIYDYAKSTRGGAGSRAVYYPYGVAVSVVETQHLGELAMATKSVIGQHVKDKIATTDFVSYDDHHYNYYYDLGELVRSITGGDNSYAAWKTAYDKAVVKFLATDYILSIYKNPYGVMVPMRNATGLGTFIPISKNMNFLEGSYWQNQSPSYIETKTASLESYYTKFGWYADGGWASVN